MRTPSLAFVLLLSAFSATPAFAENKTFVIANTSDGYGVDQCLTTGARCGALLAQAYCEAHEFRAAASFRKLETTEVTSAVFVANNAPARRAGDALIAIECSR